MRLLPGRRRSRARTIPHLAFLAPRPPVRTDVAAAASAVLAGLRRAGVMERNRVDVIWPVRRRQSHIPWYDLCIYHLGNDIELHRDIYRHAVQTPGLVVLHDLALDGLVRGLVSRGDPLGHMAVREALALRGWPSQREVLMDEPLRVPWLAHVARRARGIVVHSGFGKRYLEGIGCRTPIFVVPYPGLERGEDIRRAERRRAELRAPLEARGAGVLVGVFGDLDEAKLIDVVLAAAPLVDPSVHVLLVGRRVTGYDVDRVVEAAGLGERVTFLPNASDEESRAWLCAADVVVDLRYPHRGEVSGSLARAMQVGRPAVVSGTGAYLDLPDNLVVKVGAGRPDPGEVAAAIGDLVRDPERRERMGERARAHMEELARADATARGYVEAIEGTLTLVKDPARRALARWAGALTDMGATDEDLLGYGLSYVRALEEFARGPG